MRVGSLLNVIGSTCVDELSEPSTTIFKFECASTSSEEHHSTGCHYSYAVQIYTFAYRLCNSSPGPDLGTAFSSATIGIEVHLSLQKKYPPIGSACANSFFKYVTHFISCFQIYLRVFLRIQTNSYSKCSISFTIWMRVIEGWFSMQVINRLMISVVFLRLDPTFFFGSFWFFIIHSYAIRMLILNVRATCFQSLLST